MCTVTFIARQNGYALGMNRDENRLRAPGRAPAIERLSGCRALFPSENSGGTWIGINEHGITLALLNWYAVKNRVEGKALSRGAVVRSLLSSASPEEMAAGLGNRQENDLRRVNPFRLIAVFPEEQTVQEWQWDRRRLEVVRHRWTTHAWFSSGHDEPGAQKARQHHFERVEERRGSLDWLRALHASHQPEPGPYSFCMHRPDAATVSYTEIEVRAGEAALRYLMGNPCEHGDRVWPDPIRLAVRFASARPVVPDSRPGAPRAEAGPKRSRPRSRLFQTGVTDP